MANTTLFALPILEEAQANKHVTVNDSLNILDTLADDILLFGLDANKPATPDWPNRIYLATDTSKMYQFETGTGWVERTVGTSGVLPPHDHSGAGDGGTLEGSVTTTYAEYDDQGSDPANPAVGKVRIYAKAGKFYARDSAGTEYDLTAGVASDHDHTGPGDGGVLSGDLHATFSQYTELGAAPANPPAGQTRFYLLNDGEAYIKNSAGTIQKLSANTAGEISFTPVGTVSSVDVQAAIAELDTDKSAVGHTHAASIITNTPAGNIAATDVQAAVDELDTEKLAHTDGTTTRLVADEYVDVERQSSAPANPAAGYLRLYGLNSDGHLYQRDSAGTAIDLTAQGGGGLTAHDHTGPGDGGLLDGDIHGTHTDWQVQSPAPGNPPASTVRLYSLNDGSNDLLYMRDSAGTIRDLTDVQHTADLANTTDTAKGDALIGVKLDQAGTTARTAHDKLGDTWSVLDFGADPTGVADCIPAFDAAIAAMSTPAAGEGRRLFVPAGTYKLSSVLDITRNMVLEGESGSGDNAATVLKPDAGVAGIFVHDNGTAPDGGPGDYTVIRNIAVQAAGKTSLAHGIQANTRVSLENVWVDNFFGHGVYISALAASGQNADSWHMVFSRITNCSQHGIFIDGDSSNAGLAMDVDIVSSGNWGIYDSSTLGNNYYAIRVAGSGTGGVKTDGANARNVLSGCYILSGQPANDLVARTLIIAGNWENGFTAGTDAPILETTSTRCIQVENALQAQNLAANSGGTYNVVAGIGEDSANHTALLWYESQNSHYYKMKYGGVTAGWWDLIYNDVTTDVPISFSTASATEGAGFPKFTKGFYMNTGANQRKYEVGVAKPSSGGGPGDIVFNYLPVSGGPAAWIKTDDNPDVWVDLGIVDMLNTANTWAQPQRHQLGTLLDEQAAPASPATGQFAVYAKTDGKIYGKNSGGTEYDLTGAGGGGLVQHDHTSAVDGGVLTNDQHDGYSQFNDLGSNPTTPNSGTMRFYNKADRPYTIQGGTGTVWDLADGAKGHFDFSGAWNPPSLAHGQIHSEDFTVTGAALGDVAIGGFDLDLPHGLVLANPAVVAANTVRLTLMNFSGNTVDLAAGNARIKVFDHT